MEYTLSAAFYDCFSLRVATKFFNTREGSMQSTENLSLVSALLLTMVTITGSSEVGDKLYFVDEQTAESIYVGLSFVAQAGFFCSTIAGASVLIFSSFLDSDAEFLAFLSELAYLWKVTLGTFLLGFFSWIASTFWLLVSLIGPVAAFSLATPSLAVLAVILFGFVHATQVITRIRESLMKADAPEAALQS